MDRKQWIKYCRSKNVKSKQKGYNIPLIYRENRLRNPMYSELIFHLICYLYGQKENVNRLGLNIVPSTTLFPFYHYLVRCGIKKSSSVIQRQLRILAMIPPTDKKRLKYWKTLSEQPILIPIAKEIVFKDGTLLPTRMAYAVNWEYFTKQFLSLLKDNLEHKKKFPEYDYHNKIFIEVSPKLMKSDLIPDILVSISTLMSSSPEYIKMVEYDLKSKHQDFSVYTFFELVCQSFTVGIIPQAVKSPENKELLDKLTQILLFLNKGSLGYMFNQINKNIIPKTGGGKEDV